MKSHTPLFPQCDRQLETGLQVGLLLRDVDTALPDAYIASTAKATTLVGEAEYIIEMALSAGYMDLRQAEEMRQECGKLTEAMQRSKETEDAARKNNHLEEYAYE